MASRVKALAVTLFVGTAIIFSVASLVVRFQHPELTETELFLRLFGFGG